MKKQFSLFVLIIITGLLRVNAQEKNLLILNKGWLFAEYGSDSLYPARVPGTIHSDLRENRLIADPLYACNIQQLQWIETKDWEYKTTFRAEENMLKKKHIEIIFEGLDTYASVFLNDSLVITANDMFCQWKADIKKYLKNGDNNLSVVFKPAARKGKADSALYPVTLPSSVFVRKAQYQSGSLRSPRMLTCGRWRPVYIESWDDLKIDDVQVIQSLAGKQTAKLTFKIKLISDNDGETELKIEDENTGALYASKKIILKKGAHYYSVSFTIDKPDLWWANSMGKPSLYTFLVKACNGKNILDEKKVRTGIRALEVIKDPGNNDGNFYLKLNGEPIFVKGAVYVPRNMLIAGMMPDQYNDLILQAKESNFNLLRVAGNGIFEDELFYDLCDENGILVIQDLMFGNTFYPADSMFVSGIKKEVQQNVVRLRNHPCLALWCGKSGVQNADNNQTPGKYSFSDSLKLVNDDQNLFGKVIPEIIMKEDSGRFYCKSFPGYGRDSMDRFFALSGKSGVQSYPEISTIHKIYRQEEWNLNSMALQCLLNDGDVGKTLNLYIQREYKVPANLGDYIYISQLAQAYEIKSEIEALRSTGHKYPGAILPQYNDYWPGVSGSVIDYYHNPKASLFFIKKAFNSIIVTFADKENYLDVRIISDKKTFIPAQLVLKLVDFNGKVRWMEKKAVNIKPGMNKVVESVYKRPLLSDITLNKSLVMSAELIINDETVSQNLIYFNKPEDLALTKPEINYDIKKQSGGFEIILSTKQLAKNVFISVENCDGHDIQLSDNFFDMLPGTTISIFAKTDENVDEIRKQINVRTLFDVK